MRSQPPRTPFRKATSPAAAIIAALSVESAIGGANSGRGQHGRVVARLPDGSLRDLCTSFAQVTESPFTTAEGHTEIGAAEVSASHAVLDGWPGAGRAGPAQPWLDSM